MKKIILTLSLLAGFAGLQANSSNEQAWTKTYDEQQALDNKLMSAVMDNNIDSLKVALYEGANPNKKHRIYWLFSNAIITPVEVAIRQNHTEALQILLAHGATTDELHTQDKAVLDFMLHQDEPRFMNKVHPVEIRTGWMKEHNNQDGDEIDELLAPFIKRYKDNKGQHNPMDNDPEIRKKNDLAYQIAKKALVDTPRYDYWGKKSPLNDNEKIEKLVIAVKERLNNEDMIKYFLGGNDTQSILNAKSHITPNYLA